MTCHTETLCPSGTLSLCMCRNAGSLLVGKALAELASKYPGTKFLKIISTDCIQNYPDRNLPTVLLYSSGRCLQHLSGVTALGGPRTGPERECGPQTSPISGG
jgi:hypothetical protein